MFQAKTRLSLMLTFRGSKFLLESCKRQLRKQPNPKVHLKEKTCFSIPALQVQQKTSAHSPNAPDQQVKGQKGEVVLSAVIIVNNLHGFTVQTRTLLLFYQVLASLSV